MFERQLSYWGLQFARLQFRSHVDHIQPFSETFRAAKNVLIILPVQYKESILAGNALNAACGNLRQRHLTVVHTSTSETSLTTFPHCEVIRLDQADINYLSLPRRSVLSR